MKQTIAVVEDDASQRGFYVEALREHGYLVDEYESRQSAIDGFETKLPDLAILDIALKSEAGGGYQLCQYLKQRDATLPIIFLTSRGNELDKIYGLQLGAWDYQTKPVSLEYLIVRIESFFRIKAQSSNPVSPVTLISPGLEINKNSMQCFWKGSEIMLTPTEFSILETIVCSDEPVSIEALVKATRQGIVENNTINTHILHIRKKFKQVDDKFDCIQSRYGMGYQWKCR